MYSHLNSYMYIYFLVKMTTKINFFKTFILLNYFIRLILPFCILYFLLEHVFKKETCTWNCTVFFHWIEIFSSISVKNKQIIILHFVFEFCICFLLISVETVMLVLLNLDTPYFVVYRPRDQRIKWSLGCWKKIWPMTSS